MESLTLTLTLTLVMHVPITESVTGPVSESDLCNTNSIMVVIMIIHCSSV